MISRKLFNSVHAQSVLTKKFNLSFDHIEKYIESYLIFIPGVIYEMRLDILYTDDVLFLKHDICSFCLKHKRPNKSVSLAQNGSTAFSPEGPARKTDQYKK